MAVALGAKNIQNFGRTSRRVDSISFFDDQEQQQGGG